MPMRVYLSLACCLLGGIAPATQPAPHPALGMSLAEMRLFDLAGHRHALAEVKDKYVLVVCWAFWCDTWKKAFPPLCALAAEKNELECSIWTVSVDGQCADEIRPLLRAGRVPFPVLVDNGTWKDKLRLCKVPSLLLLDAHRRIIRIWEAYPGNGKIVQGIREVDGETHPGGKPSGY